MNMEDFHCDMLNLTFRFEASDFDKSAFLADIGVADEKDLIDEDGDFVFHRSFASREDITKQHAHFDLVIFTNGKGRADLDFHAPGPNPIESKQPDLEDSAKWVGRFFRKVEFSGQMDIFYDFPEDFAPVLGLPFPLVADSTGLAGLKVTGLSLSYPKDSEMLRAVIQVDAGETYLFMQKATQLRLDDFDLRKELESLQATVNTLVRPRKQK